MAIDFEENKSFTSRAILSDPVRPKMLDLVLKTGIVKSEQAAAKVLLVVAILIFGISFVIFSKVFSGNEPVSQASMEEMMNKR